MFFVVALVVILQGRFNFNIFGIICQIDFTPNLTSFFNNHALFSSQQEALSEWIFDHEYVITDTVSKYYYYAVPP